MGTPELSVTVAGLQSITAPFRLPDVTSRVMSSGHRSAGGSLSTETNENNGNRGSFTTLQNVKSMYVIKKVVSVTTFQFAVHAAN